MGTDGLWLIRAGAPGTVVPGDDARAVLLATDAGGYLSAVGDVNGDGRADVGTWTEGWLIVLFGSPAPQPVAIPRPVASAPPGTDMLLIHADCSFLSVPDGPVGDVNGDGRADLVVNGSDLCMPDADGSFVVFGTPTGGVVSLGDVVSRGAGLAVDRPLAPAGGDRNGDGLADLIARPTKIDSSSYVVFGRAAPGTIEMRRLGAGGGRYIPAPATLPDPVRSAFGVPDAEGAAGRSSRSPSPRAAGAREPRRSPSSARAPADLRDELGALVGVALAERPQRVDRRVAELGAGHIWPQAVAATAAVMPVLFSNRERGSRASR